MNPRLYTFGFWNSPYQEGRAMAIEMGLECDEDVLGGIEEDGLARFGCPPRPRPEAVSKSGRVGANGNTVYEYDITGMRFGRLTAVRRADGDMTGGLGARWLCRCECGRDTEMTVRSLVYGPWAALSCGCLARDVREDVRRIAEDESVRMANDSVAAGIVGHFRAMAARKAALSRMPKDITGERFDRCVAVRRTGGGGSGFGTVWLFRCDCGREFEMPRKKARNKYVMCPSCMERQRRETAERRRMLDIGKARARRAALKIRRNAEAARGRMEDTVRNDAMAARVSGAAEEAIMAVTGKSLNDYSWRTVSGNAQGLRALFSALCRKEGMTSGAIGVMVGRNHSTVLKYCKDFHAMTVYDAQFRRVCEDAERRFNELMKNQ